MKRETKEAVGIVDCNLVGFETTVTEIAERDMRDLEMRLLKKVEMKRKRRTVKKATNANGYSTMTAAFH